jgi:hypothetical protein
MIEALERKLTMDELKSLSRTILLKKQSLSDIGSDSRPKVRYIATKERTVLRIMGGAVYAMQQKGLYDKARELRRLIFSGAHADPTDALEIIGDYVRLMICALIKC